MKGKITTHALDTVKGAGAGGLVVKIARLSPDPFDFGEKALDSGGRGILIAAGALRAGVYELTFKIGDYHRAQGLAGAEPRFLEDVPIRFGVDDPDAYWHVPLLFSPHAYSTYRGG